MKKLFVLILSILLLCACYAEDKSAYDTFVERTAKAYVMGQKFANKIGDKAKDVNNEYEITENISKFIKEQKIDKQIEKLGKSVDEFTNDVKKQIKKENK